MKLVIPKQHGAWAMLIIPFLLRCHTWETYYVSYSIVLAWFFIYLATYPFLMYIKQKRKKEYLHASIVYFIIAFIFGMISII